MIRPRYSGSCSQREAKIRVGSGPSFGAPAGGYYTPSKLMGADYVLSLPGVRLD